MSGHTSASFGTEELSPQRIREQLARILQTPDFLAYPPSSSLLTYVVDQALSGHGSDIKETILGVEVFGREPGYDSRSDSIVRTQARRLREKLNQYYNSAGNQDTILIEIPKGTYVPVFRVVAKQQRELPLETVPAPGRRRWAIVTTAAIAASVVAAILVAFKVRPHPKAFPTLGVLSFSNLDADRRYDALASGLTEDLKRDLSRITSLRLHVTPLADQLSAQDRSNYAKLSRQLDVDAILDGAIVSSANHQEIRVQLVRTSDNSVLWTDHFPAQDAIASTENRIESSVASALNVKPVVLARPENPEAHNLFFAARTLWARRDAKDTQQAIVLFQQALKLDPNYALAYVGIADAYGLMTAHAQIDSKTGIERGAEAAQKALQLDPSLAEAHAALGLIQAARWNWKEAGAEYQRAIDLNPSYDRAFERAGVIRFELGDFTGAERMLRESERLDPYAMSLPLIRAELYYYWRRYDDSENLIRDVQKAEPDNPTAFQLLARDFLAQHQPERALQAARAVVSTHPNDLLFRTELTSCLEVAGHHAEARRSLEEVLHPKASPPIDPFGLSLMYARMGDRENTLKFLEAAWNDHVADLPSMRWDPALDLVRQDPQYQAIAAKLYH